MILRDLLSETISVQVRGNLEVEIAQVAYDSRMVRPGALFFALPGGKTDGARFLVQASDMAAYAAVRAGYLGDARPASTLLIVQALARPTWRVEIDAVAWKALT